MGYTLDIEISRHSGGPMTEMQAFVWRSGAEEIRLGVLFPFAYEAAEIGRWPDAYERLARFNEENGTSLTIARHHLVERLLAEDVLRGMLAIDLAPLLVRGLLVHEAPGVPFGREVVGSGHGGGIRLASPGRYEGRAGIGLWLPDPGAKDFRRTGSGLVVDVDDSRWIPVSRPPVEAGWYALDPATWVPCGDVADEPPPNVVLVEGEDQAHELVHREGDDHALLVPQPPRSRRYVIANSPDRADVGPLVRDSTKSRVATGYGLGSVTALVEIGEEDAGRVDLTGVEGSDG